MEIIYDTGDKGDICRKLNKWVSNGWDLTTKFIKIVGGGNSAWITIYYDSELDFVNKDTSVSSL